MSVSQPPRLATWLLQHLASSPRRESLVGDLIEQYRNGRSATWYWRQVLTAILVGATRDVRAVHGELIDLEHFVDFARRVANS
jgi:hypothetical protein